MKEICVLTFLGFNTWSDLKKKEVSLAAVGIFTIISLGWAFYAGKITWQYFLPPGIGSFFLLISIITKGAMGMGDGWLMIALGMALDIREFLTMLSVGLLGCAAWSGLLLTVFRKEKNTEVPFVPFLLLGYVGGMLLCR